MRNFLRSLDCLDELLLLEEELGNFSRAVDIARERGDLLLEASLLEKSGLSKEACDLLLWYVFASCLCAGGGEGWPSKQFPQKVDLLVKVKTSARGVEPRQLYKTACTEVLILLNRSHSVPALEELLTMCQSQKCMRGEIIITRRILDSMLETHVPKYECESGPVDDLCTHSMRIISQNKFSFETLIYFWNSFKETILAIFKYLGVFQDSETNDLEDIGEFCFNYLGVRKQSLNKSTAYVCLYPEAKWLADPNKRSLQKSGKLFSIDKPRLLTAARGYWSAELLCAVMKVLRILEALQNQTGKVFVSPFSKPRMATHIYEVAQLLFSWKYLKHTYYDSKSLQKYIDLSLDEYLDCVFSVNWRTAVSKDMILFRETDVSIEILKEVILKNIQGKGRLTYGQVGRVTMVLLGSPNSKTELYKTVLERLDVDLSWRSFLMVLSGCRVSSASNAGQVQLHASSLACNLHKVLSELQWCQLEKGKGLHNPICFLYLVDRLMISLMECRGVLLLCRSSLVEWLIHHEWKPTFNTTSVSSPDRDAFENGAFGFLVIQFISLL